MGNNQKSAFDIDGVVTLVAVVTAIASFLIAELYETDMWWHITIGDEIIRTLHIPFSDHFTVAGFGREYHDSHWLFQIVLALLHRLWGMGGVVLVGGVLPMIYILKIMRGEKIRLAMTD